MSSYNMSSLKTTKRINSPAIIVELMQENELTQKLIGRILESKRLLSEHLELLAQNLSILDPPAKTSQIINKKTICLSVGCTIVQYFITPKSFRATLVPLIVLDSALVALCFAKTAYSFRNAMFERNLVGLIRSVEKFSNLICRDINYFNEMMALSARPLQYYQIEHAWDCIALVKEAIEILFDATRKLEMLYVIPPTFVEYYSPMEEWRDCEYYKNNVTKFNPKNIKDFYNIFAYVQSQFLFRLALTISLNPSLSDINQDIKKVSSQIQRLAGEDEKYFNKTLNHVRQKAQQANEKLNQTRSTKNKSGSAAALHHSSSKLSSVTVAIAEECQKLAESLDNISDEDSVKIDNNLPRGVHLSHNNSDGPLHQDLTHGTAPVEYEPKDDFYVYRFDEHDTSRNVDSNKLDNENEILNFEKRITKSKFKPVLKQLKKRIEPIRQEMQQKEQRILKEKGINVDDWFPKETAQINTDDDSDDESGHEKENLETKRDKFAEMRDFLAQKHAVNLFGIRPLNDPMSAEEILE